MDLKTMNVSDVTTLETRYDSGRREYYPAYPCLKAMWALDVIVGLIASIATSLWLLNIKEIPSGVTPVCTATYLALYALNEEIGYTLGFIGTIGATLFLLTASVLSRGQRDMVLWSLYTTILVMAGNITISFRYDPFMELVPLLILVVVIGLLLNHPLLQVMGWLGAIVTLIVAVSCFASYTAGGSPNLSRGELWIGCYWVQAFKVQTVLCCLRATRLEGNEGGGIENGTEECWWYDQ